MIIAAGKLLRVQRCEDSLGDCFLRESLLFLLAAIAPNDLVGLAESAVFFHEFADVSI